MYLVDFQLAQRKGLKFYHHPPRYTNSLEYLESNCDEIWRNQKPERKCATSTTTEDFLQRKLDEWIGFRSRWRDPKVGKSPQNQEKYLVWSRGLHALNKNGETRIGGGARHWLQSTRTVTCSCKRSRTSPSSRAWEEDRKSSSPRSTSSRLAPEWRLRPIQQQFEGDYPRTG